MVWPVSLNTESRKRTLVSGVGYTANNNFRTSLIVVVFNSAVVLPVFPLRDKRPSVTRLPSRRRSLTVVFGAKPQEEPEGEHLGPGHLQFLDEQAKQEGLTGEREAL